MAVSEKELVDEDEVLLGCPEGRPEVRFGLWRRVLDPGDAAVGRRLMTDHVVTVEVLQAEADKLLAELGLAKALGVLGSQLLEIEGADRPLEVEGQEDLDAAVTALLVVAVDVSDELLAAKD